MGWPMVVASILGPIVLDKLFGGPSGAEKSASRAGAKGAGAQAAELERQTELRRILQGILFGEGEMPRGERPPTFQIPEAAGGPALPLEFLEGLQPSLSPEFRALMDIAGLSSGTSAITTGMGIANQQDMLRQGQIGQTAGDIARFLLLKSFFPEGGEALAGSSGYEGWGVGIGPGGVQFP